jgi:hypothetical protein
MCRFGQRRLESLCRKTPCWAARCTLGANGLCRAGCRTCICGPAAFREHAFAPAFVSRRKAAAIKDPSGQLVVCDTAECVHLHPIRLDAPPRDGHVVGDQCDMETGKNLGSITSQKSKVQITFVAVLFVGSNTRCG